MGANRVPRSNPAAAVEQLKARLSDAFDRFLEGVADNRQVAFDDDGWRLKTDAAEQPDPAQSDSLAELHRWLDARSRSIRLADLLIEVENDLGFSVHFQQPGEKRVDPGEVCALLAAILAHGCNLGLYTMEKVAPDIAYRRLKYVSDWRLVEENQRAALAAIVHGISRLDAAGHWGDGTTSASDGQRFAMPHKVLQRTYSTRFNDFALEFYSFVADNYAPFYSRPIECTDRDAPFVLDGVLYHESDLDLEEHYTDTHGYTEINFAAFGMVGMRFCPRIRSLHRQRIYCADPQAPPHLRSQLRLSPASSTGRPGRSHGWPPRRTSRSTPICCGMSARSSGRTSSSTARSRSTPPSSRCDALSVYHNTNGVGTLDRRVGRGCGADWPSPRAAGCIAIWAGRNDDPPLRRPRAGGPRFGAPGVIAAGRHAGAAPGRSAALRPCARAAARPRRRLPRACPARPRRVRGRTPIRCSACRRCRS